MPSIDPFAADGFTMAELCQAINLLPNNYGRIGELGLFRDKGVRTRTVMVEEKNGILHLIQSKPVGAPGDVKKSGKRNLRSFVVPHLPLDDAIMPDEYQGIRAFGMETETSELSQVINDKMQAMKNAHDITKEHLRAGALKGVILDADGTTLYNLYTEFGITQATVNFALSTDSTNVPAKCRAVLRHIDDNLMGEVMSGVHVLCSEGFFDALIAHTSVKEVFLNHQEADNRLGGDPRKGFNFGGITFEEYRGKATNIDGEVKKFIADDEAHAFPMGTMSTFETLYAPADFIETANTRGLPYYAKQEPRKMGRGIDIHTQSNPLPICYRPGVLVKLTKTSS